MPIAFVAHIIAVAILAVPGNAAPAGPPRADPAICPTGGNPLWLEDQAGKTISVSGRYVWDMHYELLYPAGCSEDAAIFVDVEGAALAQLEQFLRSAYPGMTLVNGSVSGVFTGKIVSRGRGKPAYLRIDTMAIDPAKMPAVAPPK